MYMYLAEDGAEFMKGCSTFCHRSYRYPTSRLGNPNFYTHALYPPQLAEERVCYVDEAASSSSPHILSAQQINIFYQIEISSVRVPKSGADPKIVNTPWTLDLS